MEMGNLMFKRMWKAFDGIWDAFDADMKEMEEDNSRMEGLKKRMGEMKGTDGASESETIREEEVRPDGTRITRVFTRTVATSKK